jgi:carbon monoxide dehydrogenase subunit G
MELKDQIRINAPRERVFAALNDPAILKQAIPGCESLEATSPTDFTAVVAARIGPLAARFTGSVSLADIEPPVRYTLSGEGKGGPAGFAKVKAAVELEEDGQATLLNYSVKADIGGKLGQLGGSIVDRTAQKLAGEFFQQFDALIALPTEGEAVASATNQMGRDASAQPARAGISPIWWGAAAVIALMLAWVVLK